MIALITDFGSTDIYVGVMKGVILSIYPNARLIDISHDIQPQNVREGAFALLNSYRYFPEGTLFLTVVDPGVGSSRKPVAVQAGRYTFVAPDNGVLSYVLYEIRDAFAVELNNPTYQMAAVSSTFHGRDIFAPAAAHLAKGVALRAMGTPLLNPVTLPEPALTVNAKKITGEVIHVDHFGNIMTSIGYLRWVAPERLTLNKRFGEYASLPVPTSGTTIQIGSTTLTGIQSTFAEVPRGELLALVESNGYLEIAVNQGNAAARLEVSIGDPVEMQIG
ncbi:MAG: SAM-dependent chlorinase/fluorinase [Anaerolinea sp.]|nr:SAM-dependent chlorinase/fluorinase [Anaerolinea sp.]